jgi:hypothetical protein
VKHSWGPVTGLSQTCTLCGKLRTVVGMVLGQDPDEECPAAGAMAGLQAPAFEFDFDSNGWKELGQELGLDKPRPYVEPKCECGAFKALKIGKNEIGHASYCPWRKQ